jgi:hemoglobin-like flavoprotein
MLMDATLLDTCESSLRRCSADPDFFTRFYERFLESSPKVREKFQGTDFKRQQRLLQVSLQMLLVAAQDDGERPMPYLDEVAARHSASQLAIGAELYDLWLDSLLETARTTDPEWSAAVEQAWESVMAVGISYLLARFNRASGAKSGGDS